MEWLYKGKIIRSLEELPEYEMAFGFIYIITCLDNHRSYIGQKYFYHSRTTKLSKKNLPKDGRRKKTKTVTKESDWLSYYGSSKNESFIEDLARYGESRFRREILEICCNKSYLTYAEAKWQFRLGAIESDAYYNSNILGKFYPKSTKNCING